MQQQVKQAPDKCTYLEAYCAAPLQTVRLLHHSKPVLTTA
jgi:hypothetical protein